MDEQPLGREAELAAVEAFLDRLGGPLAALVLEGEPGIGKTALWREGVRRAERRGCTVLACRPADAESKLSFAALTDLLEPVPDESYSALPAAQRTALDAALLRSTANTRADPRAVAAGVRSLLASLAGRKRVLIAVDDAQWLDASTARALAFALRRLGDEGVGLLATRRPAALLGRDQIELPEADVIELAPLSLAAIHGLLKRRLGQSLPRPLLVRVHETAGGNPFFALEIAREVLLADVAPGDPLPVPTRLRTLVRRRLGRLSAAAQEALLVASATADPRVSLLSQALEHDASEELEEAERADVVEVAGGRVRFSHPLYAAAAYSSAPQRRRARVHRRLAELVGSAEERARHLAVGAEGPDARVAAALDEASSAAKGRGALDAAAELTELAIRLTPEESTEETARRRLELAFLLRLVGNAGRADSILAELAARATGSRRANALVELAAVRYWAEGSVAGVACCERALEAARGDLAMEAKAHADLAVYCDFDLERSFRHARSALRRFEKLGERADPLAHSEALAIAARGSLMLGRGLPVEEIERARELESRAPAHSDAVVGRIAVFSAQWLKYVDDFDGARARLEDARRVAVEEGDESALPNILVHLAQTELWSGNWILADRYANESCELAEQVGQSFGGPTAMRALVDAHLGRVERARETASYGLSVAEQNPLAAPLYLRVLGFLDLSLREVVHAGQHLSEALKHMHAVRILEPAVLRIHADAVEALVAAGKVDRADEILSGWEEQARRTGIAWSLATSARCRSQVEAARGETTQAVSDAAQALAAHERLPMPFELGRTLVVKGEIERRAKQRSAARASLEQALATFEHLGAPLWAERARVELGRLGLRRGNRHELTETERRVAELAASGLTNREVAARLFMSPKTVEANLARVYRKLGIRSRAELGARLGADREPAQT